jgi:hypothetical protein
MNETHCRTTVAESHLAACALVAAGETLRPLLYHYQLYADAVHEIVARADQAEGDRLQQLAGQLRAMFHILNEALANRVEAARQAHAERLQISVEEVDARLYPPLPTANADDATKKAYERSITGQSDRWRRLGLTRLSQDRGHAFFELTRAVWLLAPSRTEIDAFLHRLDELVPERAAGQA